MGIEAGLAFGSTGSGEGRLVGGWVATSMSMRIEDRRRIAGPRANIRRADVGLGGASRGCDVGGSCDTVDGLSNDQERTRSSART